MKKFKVQSRIFFQDVHIFSILKRKLFDLIENAFESCICNDVLNIYINHYYLSHILSKWKTLKFILEDFSKMYTFLAFKKKLNLIENSFETCNLIHFNYGLLKFSFLKS
jgi:hypothetical protein